MKILLFLTLIFIIVTTSFAGRHTRESDSLELVKLYNALNGDEWENKKGWFTDPVYEWFWIDTKQIIDGNDTLDVVYDIYFSNNNLKGEFPDLTLPDLEYFVINQEKVSGNLPSLQASKKLKSLKIEITNIGGEIPAYDLPELEELYVFRSKISGSIPYMNLPSLKWLFLAENELDGEFPGINAPDLEQVILAVNKLNGVFPKLNSSKIINITIQGNKFTDFDKDFNYPLLKRLFCRGNKFSSIPDLNSYTQLEDVNVQYNKLTFKYLEQVAKIPESEYSDQDTTLPIIRENIGQKVKLAVIADGSANVYQWYEDDHAIPGETDSVLIVEKTGDYYCEVSNTIAVDVYLKSEIEQVIIDGIYDFDDDNSIKVYPMPFSETLTIFFEEEVYGVEHIKIYDCFGREVLRVADTKNITESIELSTSELAPGVYFIEISTPKGSIFKKIVKV